MRTDHLAHSNGDALAPALFAAGARKCYHEIEPPGLYLCLHTSRCRARPRTAPPKPLPRACKRLSTSRVQAASFAAWSPDIWSRKATAPSSHDRLSSNHGEPGSSRRSGGAARIAPGGSTRTLCLQKERTRTRHAREHGGGSVDERAQWAVVAPSA
eukprot:1981709-Pleurochrysis_carterae.AAC.3